MSWSMLPEKTSAKANTLAVAQRMTEVAPNKALPKRAAAQNANQLTPYTPSTGVQPETGVSANAYPSDKVVMPLNNILRENSPIVINAANSKISATDLTKECCGVRNSENWLNELAHLVPENINAGKNVNRAKKKTKIVVPREATKTPECT